LTELEDEAELIASKRASLIVAQVVDASTRKEDLSVLRREDARETVQERRFP